MSILHLCLFMFTSILRLGVIRCLCVLVAFWFCFLLASAYVWPFAPSLHCHACSAAAVRDFRECVVPLPRSLCLPSWECGSLLSLSFAHGLALSGDRDCMHNALVLHLSWGGCAGPSHGSWPLGLAVVHLYLRDMDSCGQEHQWSWTCDNWASPPYQGLPWMWPTGCYFGHWVQ